MEPQRKFKWTSSGTSNKGNVRQHNEDAWLDMPAAGLWVVADGMGGHQAGDVASRMIVDALAQVRPQERPSALLDDIEDRLNIVNAELFRRGQAGDTISGSTIVVLAAFAGYTVTLWAGDSRVYRQKGTSFEQITRDHSEVQELSDQGVTAGAESANVITRAVGGAADLALDLELRELRDGDHYLLCSDGLYKELSDVNLAMALRGQDARSASRYLVEQAMAGPCSDNVTAVTIKFRQDT